MKRFSLKRALGAGAAALVLGGVALGMMPGAASTPYAEAADPGDPGRPGIQAFIDLVAQKLGITSDRLTQAMTEARSELGIPEGRHRFGHKGPGMHFGLDLSAAAQAIGVTPEELRQELPGKSLAQVAQAHGKTADDVATALKNAANQRIDQAVTNGRLTAEQAAEKKTQAAQHIDELVNRVLPERGARPGPRGERGPRPGPSAGGA